MVYVIVELGMFVWFVLYIMWQIWILLTLLFYKFIMVIVELGVYIIHLYDAMNFF